MGSKLYLDPKAEQEANDIATQFMNSSDVIGDMSRAYGMDFSSVRIHTDESAAQRVAQTGADAFSTGRDIFFGRGAFDPNDSASRGLLAHELTHTMQQGIGGGGEQTVSQAAPEGAAQGGMLDWFKGLFGKKKPTPEELAEMEEIQNMEISEPELQSGPGTGPVFMPVPNEKGEVVNREFLSSSSYAIHQMLQSASREQLQTPAVQKLVLDDYNTNMNARLKAKNGQAKKDIDGSFRASAGELSSFNMVMNAMLPEGFGEQVISIQKQKDSNGKENMDAALDFAQQTVSQNENLMNFMAGTNASFEGVDYYDNPEERSTIMMNNLVLRGINKDISKRIGDEQEAKRAALREQGITDPSLIARAGDSVDKSDLARAGKLQLAVNMGKSNSAKAFRNLLASRFKKV